MNKYVGLTVFFLFFLLSGLHAQNLQSVIKDVKAIVENNVNKIYITADWGDNIIERSTLEYVAGTNNTYELIIKDALIDQGSLSFNSVVSDKSGFLFSTEQSDLLSELLLVDSVSEQDGNVVYQVAIKMTANHAIEAKIGSFDKKVMEIIVTQRAIPVDSQNLSENSLSNTTFNNAPSKRELTFNPDGTPYIVPDEVANTPRNNLTDGRPNSQPVPVVSSLKQDQAGEPMKIDKQTVEEQGGQIIVRNNIKYLVTCCDEQGNTIEKPLQENTGNQPRSLYSDSRFKSLDQLYIDESYSVDGGRLYEYPALMNVMIISNNKRKKDASKMAVILNKEKRTSIQTRLGMSFRVVNVATSDRPLPKTTTIFYRQKYLKSAVILSDELDGNQKIFKMLNPERKIGVDVEIVMGSNN